MLMETRKSLFWTPCAAHCIDLMLEDFGKKLQEHRVTIAKAKSITTFIYARTMLITWMKEFTKGRDLIRPEVTRFATSYLTLGCISELKVELMAMFSSCKWKSSKFASLLVGKKVQKIVMDSLFWKNVMKCLKAAFPLMKVLRMVDGEDKPAMKFVYEAMERAKEKIQLNFMNVKNRYEPILDIVNTRWASQLHRPLHVAAYYLNPHYHYSPTFKPSVEIKTGLYACIQKMIPTVEEQTKLDLQLDDYKNSRGLFGLEMEKNTRTKKSPAEWWDSYGDECPELQKFAIRVLSLTCSSSGCERNWSAFEMVHTKRRNRLHQKKMNDLVFVMYNLKLIERQKRRAVEYSFDTSEYAFDNISSDDEWITEREDHVLPTRKRWMRALDKVTECGTYDSDEETHEFERGVDVRDVRAALDAEDDLVIHDLDDDDDEGEEEDGNENGDSNKDDENIESLDLELLGDPSVPEEEYEDANDDDDDGDGDGRELPELY